MYVVNMLLKRDIFWILILMVALVSAKEEEEKSRCPTMRYTYRMIEHNNKCYQFYYGTKTWVDARDHCWQNRGRLAYVNDEGTFQFIKDALNGMSWNADNIWIGLHDRTTEQAWRWVGLKNEPEIPMTWSNWDSGEPQGWFHSYEDCVKMSKDGGKWTWQEVMCNKFPWKYRYICEFEIKDDPADSNTADGLNQNIPSTESTTITPTTKDETVQIHIGHNGNNHGKPPSGDHQQDSNNVGGPSGGLSGDDHYPNIAENKEEKNGKVPIYAVIVAFGAGIIFAAGFILFFVLRRQKRKRKQPSEPFPTVVYHSQPPEEDLVLGGACLPLGAEGAAPVCCSTGKTCKVAVDCGAEACECSTSEPARGRRNNNTANPNVYVSIGSNGAVRSSICHVEHDQHPGGSIDSRVSSLPDLSYMEEAPPSYDEACAKLTSHNNVNNNAQVNKESTQQRPAVAEPESAPEQAGNIYTTEPCSSNPEPNRSSGAIPKTNKAPTSVYMSMDGSNSDISRSSSGSNTPQLTRGQADTPQPSRGHATTDSVGTDQYVPMSLGELPPIPTDEGYEIPVSFRPTPVPRRGHSDDENTRSNRQSQTDRSSGVYSEIPDRNSHLFKHVDEIYQTID